MNKYLGLEHLGGDKYRMVEFEAKNDNEAYFKSKNLKETLWFYSQEHKFEQKLKSIAELYRKKVLIV